MPNDHVHPLFQQILAATYHAEAKYFSDQVNAEIDDRAALRRELREERNEKLKMEED